MTNDNIIEIENAIRKVRKRLKELNQSKSAIEYELESYRQDLESTISEIRENETKLNELTKSLSVSGG